MKRPLLTISNHHHPLGPWKVGIHTPNDRQTRHPVEEASSGSARFPNESPGSQILWDQLNECRVVRTPVPDELDRSLFTCAWGK